MIASTGGRALTAFPRGSGICLATNRYAGIRGVPDARPRTAGGRRGTPSASEETAVSSEISLAGLTLSIPEDVELVNGHDPVLHTAGDRPDTATLPALADPSVDQSDAELSARRADVEEKHRRVVGFL